MPPKCNMNAQVHFVLAAATVLLGVMCSHPCQADVGSANQGPTRSALVGALRRLPAVSQSKRDPTARAVSFHANELPGVVRSGDRPQRDRRQGERAGRETAPNNVVPTSTRMSSSAFSYEQLIELESRFGEIHESQVQPPRQNKAGYDKGFFISSSTLDSQSGQITSYRMKINSWFQLRHTLFDSDGSNPDQNDIEFERLRLTFGGHAYTPDLRYFFQFDGDSDQAEVSDWLDYFIRYDFGHDLFCWEEGRLGLRAGKWKLPYNRARQEAGWKLQFADRSMASAFFDINRSVGIALYGRVDVLETAVNFETAIFNGFNTGGFRPARVGELDRNFGFATRIDSDLLGQWGNDGEADLGFHVTPAVRVGAGLAMTRVDNGDGPREFAAQRAVDSGAALAVVLPPSVTAYDIAFYAVDANLKYRGFSFHSEYYARHISGSSGAAVPDLTDHGFLLQSGYLLYHHKLELISRWSRIVGNSGTLGAVDQSADEVAGGVVWYIRGQAIKVTVDATHLNGAPIRDLALNILPGDDGWLYRTQMQIKF